MELTAADIASDFDLYDFAGSVSVQKINPTTGAVQTTSTGVACLKRAVSVANVPSGEGVTRVTTTRFQLKAADVGFTPKEQDIIVDGSDSWRIGSASVAAQGTRFACEATLIV